MDRNDRTAVLGGTFTPLHAGHRALLHRALQTVSHDGPGPGHVVVGLTSTDLARQTRSDPSHADLLGPFAERRRALVAELDELSAAYSASYEVTRIEEPAGPAATREDLDVLVVSPEASAQRRAHRLNRTRANEGLRPLEVYTPPFVVAEDGDRISSTRIRNGEIDHYGRLVD
jgi:pantetheine-phosphate adenylyltransferase